jgi:hypothetical protein
VGPKAGLDLSRNTPSETEPQPSISKLSIRFKFQVILRQTVSQQVHLGDEPPSGACDRIFITVGLS